MSFTQTQEFTKDNFPEEVLESSELVLVDFWAPWCQPCRTIAPTIDELAKQYEGHVKIGKVDVDQHSDLAASYEVASIPTLLLFKDGQVVGKLVGLASKSEIEEAIKRSAA
ncbi:MAG: thioredoxin [Planctomycetota bacterium]|nr:thioredoxin [Planctomycetota bacterium]